MEKSPLYMIIPADVKKFITEKSYENRMSATAYLVELVRKEMEREKDAKGKI